VARPGVISTGTLRTAFAFGAALIVIILGAAFIAPNAIDMRSAVPVISAELSNALGQPVQVRGRTTLSLIPSPKLVLKDVTATPTGDQGIALNAEEVHADLGWGDLLLGTYDVSRLVLVRPLITAPWHGVTPTGPALPKLIIDRGQLKLTGLAAPLDIEALDAELTPAANGGLAWTVSGMVDGLAIESEGRLGAVSRNGAQNLNVTIKLPEADVTLQLSGSRNTTEDRFTGKVVVAALHASDALALSQALDLDPGRWPVSREPLAITAEISAVGDQLTISNGEAKIGDQIAMLRAELNIAAATFAANVELRALDVMRLLPAAPATEQPAQPRPLDRLFAVATPWRGEIKVNGQVLRLGEHVLRDAALDLHLEQAQWRIGNGAVTLPGQTRISFAGLWSKDSDALEGTWRASSTDLRALLSWLGVAPDMLPAASFTSFAANGAVQANDKVVALDDISIGLDASQATGRIAFGWDPASPTSLALDIDRLALDVYGPLLGAFIRTPAPANDAPGYGVAPVAPWLSALARQRGNIRLSVTQASWKEELTGQLGVDIALGDNTADIRSIAFTDSSGAALWIGGKIKNLDAVPVAESVQVDLKVNDVGRFARSADADVPDGLRNLTPWSLNAAVNGSLVEAAITLDGALGPLAVKSRGTLRAPEGQPSFDASFEMTHPNAAELRVALWPEATFETKIAGPMALTAHIKTAKRRTEVSDAVLSFGPHRFLAKVAVDDTAKPRAVTADISNINMDWTAMAPLPLLPIPAPGSWSGNVTLRGPHLKTPLVDARDFAARYVATLNKVELAEWSGRLFDGASQVALTWTKAPDAADPTRWSHALQGQVVVSDASTALMLPGLATHGQADLTFNFAASGAQPVQWRETFSGTGEFNVVLPAHATLRNTGLFAPLAAVVRAEKPDGRTLTAVEGSGRFGMAKSVVTFGELAVRSNAYNANFTGSVDLSREVFDLAGILRLKDRGQIAGPSAQLVLPPTVPMAITGPLQAPTIKLDVSQR
jgi:hypothetical protein